MCERPWDSTRLQVGLGPGAHSTLVALSTMVTVGGPGDNVKPRTWPSAVGGLGKGDRQGDHTPNSVSGPGGSWGAGSRDPRQLLLAEKEIQVRVAGTGASRGEGPWWLRWEQGASSQPLAQQTPAQASSRGKDEGGLLGITRRRDRGLPPPSVPPSPSPARCAQSFLYPALVILGWQGS